MTLNPKIPIAYAPLLTERKRYKVFYGGRGSAKSWSIARSIIIKCYSEKHRVLCCREYQRSIADSVHKLLCDQIEALGLSAYFDITKDAITSKTTGSLIIFRGLHGNASEIKSIEGITICWVEEAQKVIRESFDYLFPTIRTPGSEIWISFNPDDEKDAVYDRFVVHPNPQTDICIKTFWYDNPDFPEVLRIEMDHDRETNYDRYKHVWDGECYVISEAVIFNGKYKIKDFETPEDAGFCFGGDFGFGPDPSTLIRCFEQQEGTERNLYIDWEAWGLHVQMESLPALYKSVPESHLYAINGDNSRPETIDYIRRHDFPLMRGEAKLKVEDGLSFLLGFNNIYVHTRCPHTAEEMRLYKYKLDTNGNPTRKPDDKNNHCIDALRYALYHKIKSNGSGIISNTLTFGGGLL